MELFVFAGVFTICILGFSLGTLYAKANPPPKWLNNKMDYEKGRFDAIKFLTKERGLPKILTKEYDAPKFLTKEYSVEDIMDIFSKKNMKNFQYTALNARGEKTSGNLDAASYSEAVKELRGYGLFPTNVTDAEAPMPKTPYPPNPTIIAGKTLKEILWHPIAYVPFAGLAVANAALPIPAWANIPLVLGAIVGEFAFWRKNWASIYEKYECQLEKAYREHFNETLVKTSIPYTESSRTTINALKEAVALKADIEEKIFSDGHLNPKEKEILILLEETLLRMMETATDSKEKSLPAEIKDALDTLTELSTNFDEVVRPLNPSTEEREIQKKSGLAQSTQALKNRMEESKQVRRLIQEVKKEKA